MLVELLAFGSNTTVYRVYQWGEGTVLNLHDPLIVIFLLLLFMLCINFCRCHVTLRDAVCIRDSDVKVCVLAMSPESTRSQIRSSFVPCEAVYILTVKRL